MYQLDKKGVFKCLTCKTEVETTWGKMTRDLECTVVTCYGTMQPVNSKGD